MAEAVSPGDHECPVCLEEFTEPKLLPCTHRMCKKCVVSCLQTKGEGGCPVCNTPIRFAEGAKNDDVTALVDDLPTDMATLTLVESKRILSGDHVCGFCDESVAATVLCLDCSVMLCTPCIKVHNKIPATRGHVLEELQTLTAERLAASRKSPCEIHPDRSAELYCPDHQTLICLLCATSKHGSCSGVEGIADVAKKERAALTDQSQRLEEKEAAILAEVSALEKEIADAKKHFASTEDDINTTFDRLQKTLENRRLEIIESIQVQQEKFLTAKKAEKPPLDQQQADVATMRSLAQHLVTLPDSAFVSTLAKVKKRLDSLEAKSPERHAETCGLSKVTFDTEDQADLESSIASFGHVETDSPAPNTDEMEELHEISKPPDGPFGPVTIGVSGSAAGFGWRPFSGSVLTTTNTTTSHGKGFALTGLTRSPFGFGQPTTSTGTLSAVSSNPVSTGFTGSPFGFGQPTTSTGTLSAVSSNPVSTGFTGSPFGFGQPTTSTGTLYGVSSNPLSTGFTGSPFGFGQPTTSTGTLSFMSSGVYVDGFIVGGGTTVKFNPPSGLDTMSKSGVTTSINTRHQCITAMKEYENKSLEELRMEDYSASRKSKQQDTVFSFGQTSISPIIFN